MIRKTKAALAAAALLGCALAAQAQSSATASASFSNLQIQVEDLIPNDGIAAGYTIVSSYASAAGSGPDYHLQQYDSRSAPFSASIYHDAGNQASITSSTGTMEGVAMQANASSVSGPNPANVNETGFTTTLLLNPGTRIIVSADAFVSQSSGPPPYPYDNSVSLLVSNIRPGSGSLSLPYETLRAAPGGSVARTLIASWDNGFPVSDYAQIGGYLSVAAVAAAVPEPGESALMLGGLAVLGAAALRRRTARRG